MSSELVLECYGVRVRVSDAAKAGLCPRLAELLPPHSHVGVSADVDAGREITYVLRRDGASAPGSNELQVVQDGEVRFQPRTSDEAAQWLSREIDSTVAQHSRGGLFVHAGVVGWRGRAILVPGRSMTGKSTLVSELVRRGATYYSDEFAVIDDDTHARPYARMPVFRGTRGTEPTEEARACLRLADRPPLPVSLIVSMPYRPGATWCPTITTGARAALPVIDNTILARAKAESTLRMAARLASTVVTLEGTRPDAEIAAPRILEFLNDLLDAKPSSTERGSPAPRLLERAQAMQAAALAAAEVVPARFVVIDDVLESDEHRRLLDYARAHEADFAISGVMAPDGSSHVDPGFRKSGTIFHAHEPLAFLESRLRRLLPHIRRELDFSWFPLGRMELQMAVHQEGGFFGAHTDDGRPEVAGRRITCVYYLHGQPKRFGGGELLIYDTGTRDGCPVPAGSPVWVEPADNTAVFFPSSLLHEVRPVHRETDAFGDSRFSVNVWFWVGPSPVPALTDPSHRSAG